MELDASSHHPPGAPLPPTSRPVEWLWRYKNRHLHPQNNMIYWFYTRFWVWAFISPNRPSGPRQMPLGPIPLGPWGLLRHQAPSSSYCGGRKPKLSIDLLVLHGGSTCTWVLSTPKVDGVGCNLQARRRLQRTSWCAPNQHLRDGERCHA